MDHEPPSGEDMRRMLAGMRENVADRIGQTHRPRSTARRIGVVAAIVAVLGVGTASGALALGMIPHPFTAAPPAATEAPAPTDAPSPSSDRITPTVVPTPTPTPTPTPRAAAIPTTCAEAVPAADAERLFGSLVRTQVRPETPESPRSWYTDPETPFVADAALVCRWAESAGTEGTDGVSLQEGTTDPAVLAARLDTLASRGWTCTDVLGGRSCQRTEQSVYYGEPLVTADTFFVRDGTWVSVTQVNVPTNGLLRAVVQQTWGD